MMTGETKKGKIACDTVFSSVPSGQTNPRTRLDVPVVDAPVEAEVEGAEVATLPHHLHHRFIVELGDVPQVQNTQVT